MSTRIAFTGLAFVLALVGTPACGGGDAPEKPAQNELNGSDGGDISPPSASLPESPALPPIGSGPSLDPDGGLMVGAPSDPNVPPTNPSPTPSSSAPPEPTGSTPPPPPPPSGSCPGGEMEAEPNDVGTPNVLNTSRCGTLPPGDVDYLQINRQTAFQLSWSGFVNVQLIQNAPGGPYLLKITSQNPSATTSWQISFTN